MKKRKQTPTRYSTRFWILGVMALSFLLGFGAAQIPRIAQSQNPVEQSATETPYLPYNCPESQSLDSDTPFTLEEVEAYVGFSHPALELATMTSENWSGSSNYFIDSSCTIQNDVTYLTLIYNVTRSDMRLQVFVIRFGRVEQQADILIPSIGTWMASSVHLTSFADRNFNQLPDVAAMGNNGGACCLPEMVLIELTPDGELRDITPDIVMLRSERLRPVEFDEIDGNGVPEIYDGGYVYAPGGSLFLKRWWGWDGTEYRLVQVEVGNISSQWDVNNFIRYRLSENVCQRIIEDAQPNSSHGWRVRSRLGAVLLYYDAWSDVEAGWEVLQPVLDAATACEPTPETIEFMEAIAAFREYFAER